MRFFAKSKSLPGWLAITLDAGTLNAVQVQRTGNARPSVDLALAFALPAEEEAETLERFGKEVHAERYNCTTLLRDSEYQLLSVEAPNVPPEELKIAMRWRLKDMLDFHVDDATIDVLSIPVDKHAPTRNQSMYAVAARNQVIGQRQGLFERARIPLKVIDIPELAQRNLSALAETEGRGLAMLSLGHTGGMLTVTYGQELCLSRRIDIALPQLQLAEETQKAGLLERITLELQRSLDHVDRQFHFITLSKLLIAPLGIEGLGLKEYLATNLYLPVEDFTLESVLDLDRVPELRAPDAQQRFFLAVGAALRHEERAL